LRYRSGEPAVTTPAKGAVPYVRGTRLAVRRVMQVTGPVRDLDRLLFEA
jgi:hypothetical protein